MMSGILLTIGCLLVGQGDEVVGERPYEMDWAGRTTDPHSPLVDFEDLTGWTAAGTDTVASVATTREQQMYGKYVGKVTYQGTGTRPGFRVDPPQPIPCTVPFDTITLWVYGNNWGYARDATTPPVSIIAHFADAQGNDVPVSLYYVNAKYWFLVYRKLTPEQQERLKGGASFTGFEITGGRNTDDRSIYLDDLAVFTEELKPLTFEPRPQRGIDMFPGEGVGTNTGPGKLPFPTRPQTILPANLTAKFTTSVAKEGDAFAFTYQGDDGRLVYRLTPQTGMWDDLTAQWAGRGAEFHPCTGGGVWFAGPGSDMVKPESAEHLGTAVEGDTVISRWRLRAGEAQTEATYTYHLWQKSLVIDVKAPGGAIGDVRYGRAVGLEQPRTFQIPYLANSSGRCHAVVAGPPNEPLFLFGHPDWYLSNASVLYGTAGITREGVAYHGGTRYLPLTDGRRNDVYERFFLTVSPRFEEVLPTIPNPVSPWKDVTGTGVWRAHGAGNREHDIAHWREALRYGMRHLIITDHETGWRDEGESFTFRTKPAPKKGGDEGQFNYARIMQDELGFVYGPYNNYTDFAPVNEYWSPDLIGRNPDGQLQTAWMRCYAPKPARAVEYCAKLAPIIESKFHFSTAYCDVHTAVTAWSRTDYDARVPGAGTFAAVIYSYGEIMLHQKQAWDGPVYSEGNHHCYLHGLTDGNYAQDQQARLPENPWLVDFDLLKMHDLGCNFGMGAPSMFYGDSTGMGRTKEEQDFYIDRFLAATVAFGHPGFLTYEGGIQNALRGYYMIQQLASAYTRESVASIRYADAEGNLLDTSTALANGAFERCQVLNTYANGCTTVVNGSRTERMKVKAGDRTLDLPPAGYAGWTQDGSVDVYAGDADGHRIDYAATPEYLYVDGRGRFTRLAKAAADGLAICRKDEQGGWEVIPVRGAQCAFAIGPCTAVALDRANQELGPAEVRLSRGLTYVMPVDGAFSYRLTAAGQPAAELRSDRDRVVAGEQVEVTGKQQHTVEIPADLQPGARYWAQLEGGWIDFTVVPLVEPVLHVEGDKLTADLTCNLGRATEGSVSLFGHVEQVTLTPGRAVTVTVDVGHSQAESLDDIELTVKAGGLTETRRWVMRTLPGYVTRAEVPQTWDVGMCYRGGEETSDLGQSRAHVVASRPSCGLVEKDGLGMHPPYMGGVGYTFALLAPVRLPADPPAAFRCSVGKGDGSDPGDGILFKVAVIDEAGVETALAQQLVTEHEWKPVTADLTEWAGKTVRLKLISDVGENDNSAGDWAMWGDFRIESRDEQLIRTLSDDTGLYATEPGPYPVAGLTVADLRGAKGGWLRYDGMGLSGTGEYGSFAVVNGVELGNMAPAGGREVEGIWEEKVGVALTPECVQTLGRRNVFRLSDPANDWFKVRRFWLELELADGRKASSRISTACFTQPPSWPYFEGIGVPHGEDITVEIWFDLGD